jgi:hypothetical protein
VPGDRRTDEDILREITAEREQLAAALADLREGIDAKRRFATIVGGALATGLAAVAAFKVARRFKSE